MIKIAIFASGNGSNFEAIIKYFKKSNLVSENKIKFYCISDKKAAYVLTRAKKLNIQAFYVPFEKTYDFMKKNKFNLAVLAGYMRILPEEVLNLSVFINLHPSLLPKYKGKNAIEQAFNAKEKETGVTVHYVTKEVDSGEIIEQKSVKIKEGMTLEELTYKIHKIEHKLLPKVIEKVIKKYSVLIVGSGAREHAIAYKLKKSKRLNKLYLFKPNDGFKDIGEIIESNNYENLAKEAKRRQTDLVIIGPEQPLAEGIVDIFRKYKINCIGADKYWTQLESSKIFAKKFMERNKIPTAKYTVIEDMNDIKNIKFKFPYVIKADGLAAGKGVCIVKNFQEAEKTICEYLNGKFNEASKKIVVEEFLEGKEISLISMWDGKHLLPLLPARDYKKLNNRNKGPNTGGMGAICPAKVDNSQIKNYVKLLKSALRKEKADFRGIIYSGLIQTKDGIKVLEFNMRFGDPETQVLMLSLKSDLLEIFINTIEKKLSKTRVEWRKNPSACVVLAVKGYPTKPKTGDEIILTGKLKSKLFFAGVKKENNKLYTSSGRIISVCKNSKNPVIDVYKDIDNITYKNKIYRTDINFDE